MTRQTHDRQLDHHNPDLDSNIVLDGGIGPFSDGDGLHDFLEAVEVRRNASTSTITSGNTSVTVTHGAGYTPDPWDIDVHPTNNPTNDPGWFWVDTITSTTFKINVRANPGTSGATFAWRVNSSDA